MKFVTFQSAQGPRLGILDGNDIVDLAKIDPSIPSDLRTALASGIDLQGRAKQALSSPAAASPTVRQPYASATLAPVVPQPGKIVCLGHNYYDHAKEGGNLKPVYPLIFFRGASSLIGHGQAILRPRVSDRLDYEAELAVVIGKRAKHVSEDRALDYVFGYSCFHDASIRDYQKRTSQWTIGKNFDATGAFGPYLMTADALSPGATGLPMRLRLNGEVMQQTNTSEMIWGVAETIALLTECLTLEPGDVIAMGTPAGVGWARTPPVWMKAGDTVSVEIDGLAVLDNTVEDEAADEALGEKIQLEGQGA